MLTRDQLAAREQLRGLFRSAVTGPVSREDLRQFGIPDRYAPDVLEECRFIFGMYRRGDQGGARARALKAADAAAATFGNNLGPTDHGNPRDLAQQIIPRTPYNS